MFSPCLADKRVGVYVWFSGYSGGLFESMAVNTLHQPYHKSLGPLECISVCEYTQIQKERATIVGYMRHVSFISQQTYLQRKDTQANTALFSGL